MARVRAVLGLIAGAILILSSAAHSLLGWPGLRAELAAVQAPPDLVLGVRIGWQFGGAAMLVFGIISRGALWEAISRRERFDAAGGRHRYDSRSP